MKVTRAGVDRSTYYQPDELSAITVQLAAWDGQVGQGSVPVPDPAGNQEPYWGEQLLLEQSSQTILDGFLGQITSERGGGATGTRRVHTMTLADDNALLQGHATSGWVRPAEAPADRWAAFVTSFLPGTIDTTWLLTTNESGITLPKKTYRSDALFDDLLADTVGPTGKTAYIEHRNFHWHLPTEGQTCSIVLHDTNAPTSTSFRPLTAQRTKDGMDLRNRIYARNDAGVEVTVSDATSIARHSGAGLHQQGYSEYGSETAAEMTRDINVTLAERKDERVTWTYKIAPLTAAQAVALIPGSQMTVTAAVHSLSGAVKRIAQVTLAYRHVSGTFEATIELGYLKRGKRKPTKTSSASDSSGGSGVSGSGGGPGTGKECGCDPWGSGGTTDFAGVDRAWSVTANQSSAGGGTTYGIGGDTNNVVPMDIGAVIAASHDPTSAFPTAEGESRIFIQHIGSGGAARLRARIFAWARDSPAPTEALHWQIWQGAWSLATGGATTIPRAIQPATDPTFADVGPTIASGTLTPAATGATAMVAGGYVDIDVMIPVDNSDGMLKFVLGFGAAQTTLNASEYGGHTTAFVGSRFPIAANREATDVLYMQDGTGTTLASTPVTGYSLEWFPDTAPAKGQDVPREQVGVSDGSTTAYTTRYPYLPGSLKVWVDDVREFNVTETDPTTGAFTFDTASFAGENITVEYRGAGA